MQAEARVTALAPALTQTTGAYPMPQANVYDITTGELRPMTNKRHRAPLAIVPTSEESDFTQALLDLPEQWAPRRNAPVAKPRHLQLVSTGDGAGIAPEGPDPYVDGPLLARCFCSVLIRSLAPICPACRCART
jgi:hypothetical protein